MIKFIVRGAEFYIVAQDLQHKDLAKYIIRYNTRFKQCSWVKDPLAKLNWQTEAVQVEEDLIAFYPGNPTPVTRYSGLGVSEKLTRTELEPAATDRAWFGLTLLKRQGLSPVIFITSGSLNDYEMTRAVSAYEVDT